MSFIEKLKTYFTLIVLILLFLYPVQNYLQGPEEAEMTKVASERKPLSFSYFPVSRSGPEDIISGFGDPRGNRKHQGVDIKAERGTPVLAVMDARVDRVKSGGNGGRQIWLKAEPAGLRLYYAHLDEQWVEEGQSVQAGQAIGTVGNTGNASHTSPHLHFEVLRGRRQALDPASFLVEFKP